MAIRKTIVIVLIISLLASFILAEELTFWQNTFSGYKVTSITGNESKLFNVEINGNEICLKDKMPSKTKSECECLERDEETLICKNEVCKDVTYKLPQTISMYNKEMGLEDILTKSLQDGYCTMVNNPLELLWFKLGEESIILEGDVSYNSTDINVTQEPGYAHSRMDPNITFFMPFDRNDSSSVRDFSEGGNDGTETGSNIFWRATGGYDGGPYYEITETDGSVITVPTVGRFDKGEVFSISAWVKPQDVNTYSGIVVKETSNIMRYALMMQDSGSNYRFKYWCGAWRTSDSAYNYNTWTQVTVVLDNGLKWYVNGKADGTDPCVPATNVAADLIIGRWSSYEFKGGIDNVLIINHSLSAADVWNLYNDNFTLYNTSASMTFNQTDLSGNNLLNVTIDDCQTLNNTNLSFKVNNGDTVPLVNCNATGYGLTGDLDSANVTFFLNNDPFNFFSPLIIGNITLDAYTVDSTKPSVTDLKPLNDTTYFAQQSIEIAANVTDNIAVSNVSANITLPNLTQDRIYLGFQSGAKYNASYIIPSFIGNFNVTFLAEDSSGNTNDTGITNFTTVNSPPTQGTPILNTTELRYNDTFVNLTAYNISTADVDGDSVKSIFSWYINGTPYAVLNLPFERVNGTNSSNVYDYSGRSHLSNIGEPVWNGSGGYDGKGAYEFDGFNKSINTTAYLTYAQANNSPRTISAWFKYTGSCVTSPTNSCPIVCNSPTGNLGDCLYSGLTINRLTNTAQCTVGFDSQYRHATGGVIQPNEWNMLTYVFDNDTRQGLCYLNGINTGNFSNFGSLLVGGVGNWTIGSRGLSNQKSNFNGTIDEVYVFNHTLSNAQVWNLYANKTWQIDSSETTEGENWSVKVTPNDGKEDGLTIESNGVLLIFPRPGTPCRNRVFRNYTTDRVIYNLTCEGDLNQLNNVSANIYTVAEALHFIAGGFTGIVSYAANLFTFNDNVIFEKNVNISGDAYINGSELRIDANLTLVDTVWDDLRFPAFDLTRGGANDPDLDAGNGGLDFDAGTMEELYILAQMPHSRKGNSDIMGHFHWQSSDNTTGNVVWCLEYTWASIDYSFPEVVNNCSVDASVSNLTTHLITPEFTVSGIGKNASSIVKGRLYRNASDSRDTYGADSLLLEFDFHYESDKIGGDQEDTGT